MAATREELMSQFSSIQPSIWQSVGGAVSEDAGVATEFTSPLTLETSPKDLYTELASPRLAIQFSFADTPNEMQAILIPQDTFQDLVQTFADKKVENVDESCVADIRSELEAIVQGVCIAAGNLTNEPVVATALTIRFQTYSLPPNLQNSESLLRTNVGINAEGISGNAMWICSDKVAALLTGANNEREEATPADSSTGSQPGQIPGIDGTGLDLLFDIPLEVTVELGRVRMVVKDVIDLGSGSIVEIDKAAGEPVDLMVNGRLVARGEVVVIEDNFGVRITEILSPADRLAKLNEVA